MSLSIDNSIALPPGSSLFKKGVYEKYSPSGADAVATPSQKHFDDDFDSEQNAITTPIDSTKCPRSQSPIMRVPFGNDSPVAASPAHISADNDQTLWRSPNSPIMFHTKQYIKGWSGQTFTCSLLKKLNFAPLIDSVNNNWSLWFLQNKDKIDCEQIKKMRTWQRFGSFPSENLTKKHMLAASVSNMAVKHGDKFNFVPKSYVFPKQYKEFRKDCKQKKQTGSWIVKPADGSAEDFTITDDFNELSKFDTIKMSLQRKKTVVSQYIANPLLIDGFKFNLRFYVLVTSFNPLRVYFFNDGVASFCTESYDPTTCSTNAFAHISSTSVNKKSQKFCVSNDPNETNFGNLRSAKAVMEVLKSNGLDSDKLMRRIHDVTIKTLISAQDKIVEQSDKYISYRRNCFELFSIDVLVDDKLKPWVLDLSSNPSVEPNCLMEAPLKGKLIADMLRTLGLLNEQMPKHMTVPNDLSEKETIDVVCTLTENKNSGSFELIYPAQNWERYNSYMTSPPMRANEVIVENIWRNKNADKLSHSAQFAPLRTPSTFFRMYPTPVPVVPSPVLNPSFERKQSTFFRMYPVMDL